MTDPNPTPPADDADIDLPLDGADVAATEDVDAHDENPEDHIGDELLDPWVDGTALDWPNNDDDDEEVQD